MNEKGFLMAAILISFGLAPVVFVGCSNKEENKVTINSPAGKVTIENKDTKFVKVTDQKTGAEISANVGIDPSEMSIKVYPNAQISKSDVSMKVGVPQGTLINAFFLVNDKLDKVVDFYSKEIKNPITSKSTASVSLLGKTTAGNDVTVVISAQENDTKIYIQEMKPKK